MAQSETSSGLKPGLQFRRNTFHRARFWGASSRFSFCALTLPLSGGGGTTTDARLYPQVAKRRAPPRPLQWVVRQASRSLAASAGPCPLRLAWCSMSSRLPRRPGLRLPLLPAVLLFLLSSRSGLVRALAWAPAASDRLICVAPLRYALAWRDGVPRLSLIG